MSEIQIFNNEEFGEVKVIGDIENPLFSLEDVGFALGYVTVAKGKEYLHKVRVNKIIENGSISTVVHGGTTFINEDGLYEFILESKTEVAKRFRKWVTSEVLPTIRKTGGFVEDDREEEFIAKYFPSFSKEVQLSMVNDLLKTNKELKPKAEYYDKTLQPSNLRTMTDIAKDLGMSARKLNKILHELKIIFPKKVDGKIKGWYLYSDYEYLVPEYADYHISEYGQILKFSELGRQFIIEQLEKNEII